MSYHPASDEVHVTLEIPCGTADRASGVEVWPDVFATMRDGVRLGADIYVPAGLGPAPAVIIRQPYGKQTDDMEMDVVGGFFARKGYASGAATAASGSGASRTTASPPTPRR